MFGVFEIIKRRRAYNKKIKNIQEKQNVILFDILSIEKNNKNLDLLEKIIDINNKREFICVLDKNEVAEKIVLLNKKIDETIVVLSKELIQRHSFKTNYR